MGEARGFLDLEANLGDGSGFVEECSKRRFQPHEIRIVDLELSKVEPFPEGHEDDPIPIARDARPSNGIDKHPQAERRLE